MKRSGSNYENFFRDLRNYHVPKVREQPHDISEAHRQIECFEPAILHKKKIDEVKVTQHTQTRNEDKSSDV